MRMFRSFLMRMALILSTTGTICLFLMSATLGIQGNRDGMIFLALLCLILLCWLLINLYVVRKTDPELSVEVARLVFPSGAVLSVGLSFLLALVLRDMLPEREGIQHYITLFVGIGVGLFLLVRCFDIKWLRGEDEIVNLEQRGK
jgi:ascorbate-specific PTS system EIIC-type component UlaA